MKVNEILANRKMTATFRDKKAKEALIYSVLSLMKPLAIRLSQQAGKSLVIPRRRESSQIKALDTAD